MVDREGGREGGRERRRGERRRGEREKGGERRRERRRGERKRGERRMERMGPTCTHVPVSNKDEGFFKNLIQTFVLFVRVLL